MKFKKKKKKNQFLLSEDMFGDKEKHLQTKHPQDRVGDQEKGEKMMKKRVGFFFCK